MEVVEGTGKDEDAIERGLTARQRSTAKSLILLFALARDTRIKVREREGCSYYRCGMQFREGLGSRVLELCTPVLLLGVPGGQL